MIDFVSSDSLNCNYFAIEIAVSGARGYGNLEFSLFDKILNFTTKNSDQHWFCVRDENDEIKTRVRYRRDQKNDGFFPSVMLFDPPLIARQSWPEPD